MTHLTHRLVTIVLLTAVIGLVGGTASGQIIGNDQYTFKIYAVNSAFYPIVQLYLRTWDQDREPLMNVNYMNIGLMVKGRNYDPAKIDPQTRRPQYNIETLQNRQEAFRTVLVLDCSLSMAGKPFADAQNALMKYVEAKRPSDQIAVIAIRDTDEGYQLVSGFQKDPTLLYQLISDVECDGQRTRLYDAVAAAMEMCATASQGDMNNAGAEHAVLNTILVLSDGKDEGSAVARDELMNRIGQLSIPIPIYSLAYAKSDASAFLNLEALSKGSFGRYWKHADSQEFGATVQHIHRINRSDYVLTFRSYLEVDGEEHAVKVGISWPSNTGRFVYDSAAFEAVDSPAKYVAETQGRYEQLNAAFPLLPGGPWMVSAIVDPTPPPPPPPPPPVTPDDPLNTENDSESGSKNGVVDPVVTPLEPAQEEDKDAMAFLKENGGLIGLGAGLLAVIIALFAWVRRSGTNQATRAGLTTTNHATGTPVPRNSARTSVPDVPPADIESSDTTTRF